MEFDDECTQVKNIFFVQCTTTTTTTKNKSFVNNSHQTHSSSNFMHVNYETQDVFRKIA